MDANGKGDFGTIKAIQWFIYTGYEVFVPFSENSQYDLVVSKDGGLVTIQCKYTSQIETGGKNRNNKNYSFHPTRVVKGKKDSPYKKGSVDYFFITCSNMTTYLIPGDLCCERKHIRLGKKYEQYKVILNKVEK